MQTGQNETLAAIGFSQCVFCKRQRQNGTCEAFPGVPYKIPLEILRNIKDHRDEYPGDGGLRFEAIDREAAESQDKAIERKRVNLIEYGVK